jgi:hypothetical protein
MDRLFYLGCMLEASFAELSIWFLFLSMRQHTRAHSSLRSQVLNAIAPYIHSHRLRMPY